MKLIFKGPINSTSLGNVSVNILRELFNLNFEVAIFETQESPDLSVFDGLSEKFINWIKYGFNNRYILCEKDIPTLQVWHIRNSQERLSRSSFLYTFHETDSPTFVEKKICESHDKVFFSSNFSTENFKSSGLNNCSFVPLGFDKAFSKLKNPHKLQNKVHFGLMGKMEKRKHTLKIISNWAKIFGNDPKYELSCLITNKFIPNEIFNQSISSALQGEFYENINFIPFLSKNSDVNNFINSIDIDLTGLSGGEGWNLPAFNATAIGKTSCVLNSTSHKDWATKENSVIIEPSSKISAHDGVFFVDGQDFNQGSFFDFSEDLFQKAIVMSLSRYKKGNPDGEKLQETFSYKNTVNKILSNIF